MQKDIHPPKQKQQLHELRKKNGNKATSGEVENHDLYSGEEAERLLRDSRNEVIIACACKLQVKKRVQCSRTW